MAIMETLTSGAIGTLSLAVTSGSLYSPSHSSPPSLAGLVGFFRVSGVVSR
jgi:hypothetical protein